MGIYTSLHSARQAVGLSTDQMATRLGVNQSTIVRAEKSEKNRTISLSTLERSAHALGLRLEYRLVSANNKPTPISELQRNKALSVKEKILLAIELSELTGTLSNAKKSPR